MCVAVIVESPLAVFKEPTSKGERNEAEERNGKGKIGKGGKGEEVEVWRKDLAHPKILAWRPNDV